MQDDTQMTSYRRFIGRTLAPLVSLMLMSVAAGCWSSNPPEQAVPPDDPQSLYHRLGGEPLITAVVENWIDSAPRDPNVNVSREGHPHRWEATDANVAQLKQQ